MSSPQLASPCFSLPAPTASYILSPTALLLLADDAFRELYDDCDDDGTVLDLSDDDDGDDDALNGDDDDDADERRRRLLDDDDDDDDDDDGMLACYLAGSLHMLQLFGPGILACFLPCSPDSAVLQPSLPFR